MTFDMSNLSKHGQELYENDGFYEVQVPYQLNGKDNGGTPFNLTIDFVLPEPLALDFPQPNEPSLTSHIVDERIRFVNEHLLELLNKGFVIQISDASSHFKSLSEAKEQYENGSLTLVKI